MLNAPSVADPDPLIWLLAGWLFPLDIKEYEHT
jgi:hypothetical protein